VCRAVSYRVDPMFHLYVTLREIWVDCPFKLWSCNYSDFEYLYLVRGRVALVSFEVSYSSLVEVKWKVE